MECCTRVAEIDTPLRETPGVLQNKKLPNLKLSNLKLSNLNVFMAANVACLRTLLLRTKVFRKLDVDGDGTVTSLQFKKGLRKLGIGEHLAEKDVRRCAWVPPAHKTDLSSTQVRVARYNTSFKLMRRTARCSNF